MMRSVGYLIRKSGRLIEFTVPGAGGDYDENGRYAAPQSSTKRAWAAVMSLSLDDLRLYEAGTYTSKDHKVVTYGHVRLPQGTTFTWQGTKYEIVDTLDNTHLVDACVHIAVCKGGDPK